MSQNEEIINRLDEIEFHDAPVVNMLFKTEHTLDFIINFALFQESKKDYDYWGIKFIGIKELKSDNLTLNSDSELEIFSLEYDYKGLFECKVHLLCGIGQPSFQVKLKCERIELIESTSNSGCKQ